MLHTEIRKNQYMDYIALMLLSRTLEALPGIKKAAVMKGTPANREILALGGFGGPDLDSAAANDMVVVWEGDGEAAHRRAKRYCKGHRQRHRDRRKCERYDHCGQLASGGQPSRYPVCGGGWL